MGNNKSETSDRKQVRFYKDRACYSWKAAKNIFLQSPIAHVAFLHPCGTLMNVPLILVVIPDPTVIDDEEQDAVYLHTHLHSGLVESVNKGFDTLTATNTIIDGIIFSPTPHDHSLNYRSATLHLSEARLISQDMNDEEALNEKRLALNAVVNTATGQNDREKVVGKVHDDSLKHTAIIKCKIENFSCKQRHGGFHGNKPVALYPPNEEAERSERGNAFKGVVPCWTEYGNPIGYGHDQKQVQKALFDKARESKVRAIAIANSLPEGILDEIGGKPK